MICDRQYWCRLLATAVVAVAVVVMTIASVGAIEPKAGPARIAYVSVQKVLGQYPAAQASAKRFQQFRDEKARAIAEKQKQVETLRLQIAQLGGVLQASKRAKAIRDEERARAEFQALQSEAQAGMQKMQRDSQAEFQSDMSAVLGELAKQRGADIVLNQDTSVIWAHSGMDWTNDVVERLNARHTR